MRIALNLDSDQEIPRDYGMTRVSFGDGDSVSAPREAYLYGALGSVDGIVATGHLTGSLRFARAGSYLTSFYLDGGNWIEISGHTATADDLYFGVSAWSHESFFADQEVKLAFDNVEITSGAIVCPEDTPTVTLTLTSAATPTPTATRTATATPTPTSTATSMPTTPPTRASYLPAVPNYKPPTATPTPTLTPTPIPTLTATPRATKTDVPEDVFTLEDGTYVLDVGLDEGWGAWMTFRVKNGGTTATDAAFLVDRSSGNGAYQIYCYRTGFAFNKSTSIENGAFGFVDLDAIAHLRPGTYMRCTATSSTSAMCSVQSYPSGDDYNLGCGSAKGTVRRK